MQLKNQPRSCRRRRTEEAVFKMVGLQSHHLPAYRNTPENTGRLISCGEISTRREPDTPPSTGMDVVMIAGWSIAEPAIPAPFISPCARKGRALQQNHRFETHKNKSRGFCNCQARQAGGMKGRRDAGTLVPHKQPPSPRCITRTHGGSSSHSASQRHKP